MLTRSIPKLRAPGPGSPPSRRSKHLLVKTGEAVTDRAMYGFLGAFNYVHLGWWLKRRGFDVGQLVERREQVFEAIAASVGDLPVLYLEFGVADGYSMRCWSRLLTHPESMLHGFDSFEGLPAGWGLGWPAGCFSRDGEEPTFDDDRIKLFRGWFSDTLPKYDWPPDVERLIVTLDADLYTSTAYVLGAVQDRVTVGTVLYFDEFHHYADELRAFDELLRRTGWTFEILAATRDFSQIAFGRVR